MNAAAALALAGLVLAQERSGGGAFPEPRAAEVPLPVALESGVAWLVAHQAADGSFGSHETARPIEVLASVPGSQEAFQVATTALCVIALREAGGAGADAAAARALDHLVRACAVKRQSGLEHYNVWSFGYGLQCFAERLLSRPQDRKSVV